MTCGTVSADDHRLIAECLQGDTAAFGVLVRRHQDRLYNTVYRLVDNAEDAQEWEDLLQEAFRAKDLDHWLPLLQASPNVAFEVAVTSEEGLTHPQIVHNGDVVTIDDPARGAIRQVGPVGHFDKTPIGPTRSAPDLGDNAGPLVAHEFPAGGSAAPKHPFDGITVVEFGYFYAMPYATAMLAALGARVIKIEGAAGVV